MKIAGWLLISMALAASFPRSGLAASLNLATLSCDKYENEIVGSSDPEASAAAKGPVRAVPAAARPDAINTVMWLFGFSVARTGEHFMYGDALTSFGFALDAQCKNSPATSLLEAVVLVRPDKSKPMDLKALDCRTFESRHADSAKSDPDSARTIMMWLFGFSVGLSGNHVLNADGVDGFAATLQNQCARDPTASLFDALAAVARPAARR